MCGCRLRPGPTISIRALQNIRAVQHVRAVQGAKGPQLLFLRTSPGSAPGKIITEIQDCRTRTTTARPCLLPINTPSTPIALRHRPRRRACCKLWHVDTTNPDMHVMWEPHSCTLTFSHMNKSLSDYLTAWKFMMKTAQLSDIFWCETYWFSYICLPF